MIAATGHNRTFTVFHLCAGIGGGALGFARGHARVGQLTASFRTLGGVDVDPLACADFRRLVGAPCTELDLFSRAQFEAFHGHAPPATWREATPEDLRRAAGGERPDVIFTSPPCKGLSALLNSQASASAKYQALNELVPRSLDLAMEAWGDDPPSLILLENVPRILTRGRVLLDRVKLLLDLHGYTSRETVHDCGELGGLAQRRQRFLLVARHRAKIRPFLYEPDRRPVRGIGEVIGQLPMPDAAEAGPMHRLPRLEWATWVRLALIEAGSDWRSLQRLDVRGGIVQGLRLVPERERHSGALGVRGWEQPAFTVTGESLPGNGAFSVADPRSPRELGRYEPYGVVGWDQPSRAVTAEAAPGAGPFSVADPRAPDGRRARGKYRVTGWDEAAGAVIGASSTGEGAFVVADPRLGRVAYNDILRVVRWDEGAVAVTSSGMQSVADPRLGCKSEDGEYASARHYGVLGWNEASPAVTGSARHDNGAHSVADPRPRDPGERCCPWIWSLDGTRHRPLTTLELAALQGYPVRDLVLGGSDSVRREHIGNSVPVATAEAIASTMLQTLLMASAGQGFALSSAPIWVDRQLALATVLP
ncbi:MAG TPA: DNA cytosine methyltransferase [Phycisphaerales bacterium]|nr:DNA cytosine methyltransferase [Phycisphaerales bacterium]